MERSREFFNRVSWYLAYECGSALRAEFSVPLRARAAPRAYTRIASAHHGNSLLGVAGLESFVIGVRNLAGPPVKLELAERVDRRTLMDSRIGKRPRQQGDVRAK